MSFIGWLDYSEAEQRQVRELMKMFGEKGTVDDLGIGTIRDAISNRLFPGTSIVQTRARYFLFIPWIYQRAEERHREQLVARAEAGERKLIEALRQSRDQDGLIGREAGKDVRTLPSAIYWTGIAAYGIFLRPGMTRSQYGRAAKRGLPQLDREDELADRAPSYWDRGIPEPPDGFFDYEAASFQLSRDEATWLSERVLSTEPMRGPNLLGSYVRQLRSTPVVPQGVFWDDPLPDELSDETQELVHHAQRFSCAFEGAALLYNQMLHLERDTEDDAEHADELAAELALWAERAQSIAVPAWASDVSAFWALLSQRSRIPKLTVDFVEAWCGRLRGGDLRSIAADETARLLVRNRELQHKRSQARFGNVARLRSWNGASGLTPLEFRWSQIQRFLTDLSDGLHAASGDLGVQGAAH